MEFTYTLIEECKKFLGCEPYNTDTNVCKGDAIYLESLYCKYGESTVKAVLQHCKQQFESAKK